MEYDVIVVGAGQAGGPLAGAFAKAGLSTALIEREHVGGTCINEGCTPTKTMVASARVAYLVRRAADYGVVVPPPRTDMERVRARKREIVRQFRTGSENRLDEAGVELVRGEARFVDERTLAIRTAGAERVLRAPRVIINTGARPTRPDVPGLSDVPWLDSTSVMELAEVPGHLLVIGGGYIGLEFGQMFRRFGSAVTVVQRAGQLLPPEDGDVADAVTQILRDDGIDVLVDAEPVRFERSTTGVRATLSVEGAERTVDATHVLLAAGRTPNTDALDPAAGGIELDERGFIRVNDRLETTAERVWAVGDVKGGPAFTHISYDDHRIVKTNILGRGGASTKGRAVPYTVFIDPQLGRIGITEKDAHRDGREVRVATMPMSHVARALEMDEPRGLMKVIVDASSDQILGCAILGVEGGEIMGALQIAMMGDVPFPRLRDATFAHPTLMESLNNLFATLDA